MDFGSIAMGFWRFRRLRFSAAALPAYCLQKNLQQSSIFLKETSGNGVYPVEGKEMQQWPETKESLIMRVKDPADVAAWTAFLEVYRPVVYRMARARGVQDADAEDLTQQVFWAVAGAIDRWQPEPGMPPFRMWLAKIARNAIINAVTRLPKDAAVGGSSADDLLAQVPSGNDEATRELVLEGQRQAMRWAAERIRHEFSESVWLMFHRTTVQGRPIEEVAAEMGRTRGAVYVARYRVTQRLKQKVQEAPEIEGDLS